MNGKSGILPKPRVVILQPELCTCPCHDSTALCGIQDNDCECCSICPHCAKKIRRPMIDGHIRACRDALDRKMQAVYSHTLVGID